MQTVRIKIEGKVQGVFYRQRTKEKAGELGLKGTVRNCDDDSVEVIATGAKEQLDKLIGWCKLGPPRARVTNVYAEELSLREFKEFSIIR